jgi:hypothetical protein
LSKRPRLRGTTRARESLYPLGEFPDEVIVGIGRLIVHRLAVGHADITGDDFASIFARAINGEHRARPLGITDVIWKSCSWSAKTVSHLNPYTAKKIRLITGRNSPIFSSDIKDVFADLSATGESVLNVWNERVNQSLNEYNDLRIVTLLRNMNYLQFSLFESEASRYIPSDYEWTLNKKRNFVGHEKNTGKLCFTWQPHGAQFTVHKDIPASLTRFRIKKHPGMLDPEHVLRLVKFNEDWIERVGADGEATTHDEGSGEEHHT